jgi:hypothetical protein
MIDPAAPDAKSELLEGKNRDDATACAVILELHATRDPGENRVVFTETGIETGTEPASTLPHDDRAAGHEVAVVRLHAEPLRIGIAAVA